MMQRAPVIPVLVIDEVDAAVPLARALVDGGLPMLEVTLRTPHALAAVRAIVAAVPDAIVGVGTVVDEAQLDEAVAAGAQFAVSPGYTAALSQRARSLDLSLLPGVATPSDILHARAGGHRLLKFFPAEQAGGVAMLQALHGPFADMRFCPTGGISLTLAPAYLALPNVVCVGASWVAPAATVRAQDWQQIQRLAGRAAALGRGAVPSAE